MTAGFTKGRNAYYGYYVCQQRDCSQRKKSIRMEKIEGEFEELLARLTPAPGLFQAARAMLGDLWDMHLASAKSRRQAAHVALTKLERRKAQFLDRLINADSQLLVSTYENEIKKIEEEKLVLSEKTAEKSLSKMSFDEIYRTACTFLENPMKLWVSDKIELKRLVLRLCFSSGLPYSKNEGYRTAKTTLPFNWLSGLGGGDFKLVGPEGLEPPTNPL